MDPTITPESGELRDRRIDLDWLDRRLEAIQRDPTLRQPRLLLMRSTPPPVETPLVPDPMRPLDFFRETAKFKADAVRYHHRQTHQPQVDYRIQISDARYWRCEADFYARNIPKYNDWDRQSIADSAYWRCEAEFWLKSCREGNSKADRHDIDDSDYWKIEAQALVPLFERECAPEKSRSDIRDRSYWKTETFHYSAVMDSIQEDQRRQEEFQEQKARELDSRKKRKRSLEQDDELVSTPSASDSAQWLQWWTASDNILGLAPASPEIQNSDLHKRPRLTAIT